MGLGQDGHTNQDAGEPLCDPISVLQSEFSVQSQLCDLLELIADNLPLDVDPGDLRAALPLLKRGLQHHVFLQEQLLFPVLRARATIEDKIDSILGQVEREHAIDQCLAVEIGEDLEILQHTGTPQNPNMLGYMLRSFFENQRRHMAWEAHVVLPLARQLLSQSDRERLASLMADPQTMELHLATVPVATG